MVMPYQTMTGVSLAAMRIGEMAADDAQLFLWAPSRSLGDAWLLIGLWGFRWRGLFIWKKQLGMGLHIRHQAEFVLWAAKKGAKSPIGKDCPHQIQEWSKPARHSEKPQAAYDFFASLSPPPRIDIFARQRRPGYDAWGNEIE